MKVQTQIMQDDLENKVRELTEEMESFSYSVAHDLRAPLRAINVYANILKDDHEDQLDEEGKKVLAKVLSNAKKLGHLIDEIRSFAALGQKEVHKSRVDMTKMVHAVLNSLGLVLAQHPEITVIPLHQVLADPAMIQDVLKKLISNAVKYSAKNEKSHIEISSKAENGMVTFSISDNGVGFDMRYADKLFGMFQRLHAVEEFAGSGTGLAKAKRIISKHGGSIWAEAKPDKGATFYFSLPIG